MRKCRFCAEDIQDAAIVCKHCGRDLIPGRSTVSPSPPIPVTVVAPSHTVRNLLILMIGGLFLVLVLVGLNAPSTTPPRAMAPVSSDAAPAAPAAAQAVSSPANLAINMDDWRRLVVGTGEPCDRVTRAFRAGADAKGTTFTSVSCADGHTYQVSGKANDLASVRVLSCALLYTVAKLRCFVLLNDQR